MSIEILRGYEYKRFEPGQIATWYRELSAVPGIAEKKIDINAYYDHGGGTKESKELEAKDLDVICEIRSQPSSLSFRFRNPESFFSPSVITLSYHTGGLCVYFRRDDPDTPLKLIDMLEETLALKCCEERVAETECPLTCFLSYRFSPRSKPLALELTRFLELLEIKVVSGAGYEPRRVSEKVMSRLDQSHDFFVYLITAEGESTWTRDELALALGKVSALILLVEKGVELKKGLLEGWEYIEFDPGHIGDTFIGILEALRYIRREKEANRSAVNDEE